MEANQAIISLAQSYGFDNAEYLMDWYDFHVFRPTFNDPDKEAYIGEPVFILYDGKTTRVSASEEWGQIIDALSEKKK